LDEPKGRPFWYYRSDRTSARGLGSTHSPNSRDREDGVAALCSAVTDHYEYLSRSGKLAQIERERLKNELNDLLQTRLLVDWHERAGFKKWMKRLKK
jgi:putative protein kinase ArgK-like GTPase of G3E family